jgi:acyl-coenzyme A synthetase/AMP-(fatty) acid ligase
VLRAPADEAELIAFLRGRLAAYKLPKQIQFVAELPRTASGKLRRIALKDHPPETQ